MAKPRLTSPPVTAVYEHAHANEAIHLASESVEYIADGAKKSAAGVISFTFRPRFGLQVLLHGVNGFRLQRADFTPTLRLSKRKVSLRCLFLRGSSTDLCLGGATSCEDAQASRKKISHLRFHLVNFPRLWGSDTGFFLERGTRSSWCGSLAFSGGGWDVGIHQHVNSEALEKELEQYGGYALTHVGELRRSDGSEFDSSSAKELLNALHHFLSFMLGRWSGLAFPVGFDAGGSKVWEQWGVYNVEPDKWNASLSWLDVVSVPQLTQGFDGFLAMFHSKTWSKPIKEAIYWYTRAVAGGTGMGVDTGLILAQTAIEKLAWTYCVQHKKMVTAERFSSKYLRVVDQFRLLVTSLDLPVELPPSLRALRSRRGKRYEDSMEAITSIRNGLVHANEKDPLPDEACVEAWKLSLWYLDLILLRLFGHDGTYASRLSPRFRGQVLKVPWAKQD